MKVGTALEPRHGGWPAVPCQLSQGEQYLPGFVLGDLSERTALKNAKTMENGLLTTLNTCETSVILQKNPVIFTQWSCPP